MQHLYRKTQSTPVLEASIGRPVSNQAKSHSSCDLSSPEGQGTRYAPFFFSGVRVSLCNSPGCPGTHHLVFFLGMGVGSGGGASCCFSGIQKQFASMSRCSLASRWPGHTCFLPPPPTGGSQAISGCLWFPLQHMVEDRVYLHQATSSSLYQI